MSDNKYPRVNIAGLNMEVMPEKDIVREAKEQPTFVVLCPVGEHPLAEGGIPGSTKVPCSGCNVECWQAPSTASLRGLDSDNNLVAICLNCLLAMKRDQ
jgi:hypothetical protein